MISASESKNCSTMIKFLALLGLVAFVAAQSFEDYRSSEVKLSIFFLEVTFKFILRK